MDAPAIVRGVVTGFMARPTAKTSIGKVFQDRAARYGRQRLHQVRRRAAHLPTRPTRRSTGTPRCSPRAVSDTATSSASCCATRRSRCCSCSPWSSAAPSRACSTTTSAARCSRTASGCSSADGGRRRDRSDRADHRERRRDRPGLMTVDELQQLAATAPTHQSGCHRRRAGQGQGLLHLHVGHHGDAEGQRHDALPLAARAGRIRRPRHAADQRRHAVLLPAALPQQRVDGGGVVGAQRGCHARAGQVVLGVEVLGRRHRLRRDGVRLHRRDLRLPAQPAAEADRPPAPRPRHRGQRTAPRHLGRVHQAGSASTRVCEFYAASEGNTAFLNVFNIDKTTGICPSPIAFVEYDERDRRTAARRGRPGPQGQDRAARTAAEQGQQLPAVRRLHRQGRPARRSWCATPSRTATSGSTPAT